MYGREYEGRELHFEASGGLLHASLVMQDKETDSYWSIMTGDALAGTYRGTPLEELAVSEKTTWRDWVARHPDTLVLSVDGEEHSAGEPYANYFDSDRSFRGAEATDPRLPTKEPIYAFESEGQAYAVPHDEIEGGATFVLDGGSLWLYRPPGAEIFYSTQAFSSPVTPEDFAVDEIGWRHLPSGARFDRGRRTFTPTDEAPQPVGGFDTFWFNWSMTHPDTKVLTPGSTREEGATD